MYATSSRCSSSFARRITSDTKSSMLDGTSSSSFNTFFTSLPAGTRPLSGCMLGLDDRRFLPPFRLGMRVPSRPGGSEDDEAAASAGGSAIVIELFVVLVGGMYVSSSRASSARASASATAAAGADSTAVAGTVVVVSLDGSIDRRWEGPADLRAVLEFRCERRSSSCKCFRESDGRCRPCASDGTCSWCAR